MKTKTLRHARTKFRISKLGEHNERGKLVFRNEAHRV